MMSIYETMDNYAFSQEWVAFENVLYDKLYYFYDPKYKIVYCFDENCPKKWYVVRDPVKLYKLKQYNL
jgi:hypothetical protein